MTDNVATLLDDIERHVRRFVVMPDEGAAAVALYILASHFIDVAQFAPILLVRSPELRCGKTTLLDLIGEMVRQPLSAVNASPAALYRAIDQFHPTLLLDEVDAFLAQKSEQSEAVRGILNAGHRRGRFSTVLRCEGQDFKVREFNVFGFKVLSGIGTVHATLADRSIQIPMRRKLANEHVQRFRIAQMEAELGAVRERCEAAAEQLAADVERANPEIPAALSDRGADNWDLLLALADLAGETWAERARTAAVELSQDDDASPRIQLLRDIRDYFSDRRCASAHTSDLLEYLADLETSPWGTWHRDGPMRPRDLAKLLKPLGIEPANVRGNRAQAKGYRLEQFVDAFARYLPPELAVPTSQDEANSLQDSDLTAVRNRDAGRNEASQNDGGTQWDGTIRPTSHIRPTTKSIQDKELDRIWDGGTEETEPADEPVELEIF